MDQNPLCGTCVRLYKYLVPAYLGEFEASLRQYVLNTVALRHDGDSPEILQRQVQRSKLLDLYGDLVVPPDLARLYNVDLARPDYACAVGTDVRAARAQFHAALSRHVLFIEERPVVSVSLRFPASCGLFCGCTCWVFRRLS